MQHDGVVWIPAGRVVLEGRLAIPPGARAIVVVAWANEPRSQYLAHALHEAGLATLIVDLTTPEETADDRTTMRHRFDARLIARRLAEITHWLATMGPTEQLHIGHLAFGSDVAPTLSVAADLPHAIRAIVALSGRPKDAGAALPNVTTPTLLVVGGKDLELVPANAEAHAELPSGDFAVVPSAGHRFDEPGALTEIARLATDWFGRKLAFGSALAANPAGSP